MFKLLIQLFVESILSGSKAYIAFHPELGVPVGIFNYKDEPDYESRVRSIKKMGTKGNKLSYKLALYFGIDNPIPSYAIEIEMEDGSKGKISNAELDKLARAGGYTKGGGSTVTEGTNPIDKAFKAIETLAKERTPRGDMTAGDLQKSLKLITDMKKGTADLTNNMDVLLDLTAHENTLRLEISKTLGLSNAQVFDTIGLINESAEATAEYGIRANKLLEVFMSISNEVGRNLSIPAEALKRGALLEKTLKGMDFGKFAAAFDTIGFSIEKAVGGIDETDNAMSEVLQTGREMGVVMEKFLGKVVGELKLVNTYGFEKGVTGLASMVAKGQRLGIEMSTVTSLADKFFDPEGAIDFAARMQVIGGAVGDLGDPFKLMYMATNDLEGLQDAITDTAAKAVTFDKEKNKLVISPEQRRKLKDMAEAMGTDYQTLADTAIKAARETQVMGQLDLAGDFSDVDKELIASMASIGENGEAKIRIPGISEMVDVASVTDEQLELLRKEGESDSSIYAQQLTEAEVTNQYLSGLEAMARLQIQKLGFKPGDIDAMSISQKLAKELDIGGIMEKSEKDQKTFSDNKATIEKLKAEKNPSKNNDKIKELEEENKELQMGVIKRIPNALGDKIKEYFESATNVQDLIITPSGESFKTKAGDFLVAGTNLDGGTGGGGLKSALENGGPTSGGKGVVELTGTLKLEGSGQSADVDVRKFLSRLSSGDLQNLSMMLANATS